MRMVDLMNMKGSAMADVRNDDKDSDATAKANRGTPPHQPDGAVKGSGAGAGGGGSPEDYDSDPQGGGGTMPQHRAKD
ncbi:MAG: hypothetical protein JWR77_2126 [Rhizorhabdus sp.]|nr:hypothetical protein [Rhizorhabdus sp.]